MNGNFRENFLKFFTFFYKNVILKDLGGEFWGVWVNFTHCKNLSF